MEEWIFLDTRQEAEVVYRLGKNLTDGRIYHLERLPIKLRYTSASELRKQLTERRQLFAENSTGVLSVIGPISEEGETWLGWEARHQESWWSFLQKRPTLEVIIPGLTALIQTYAKLHQQGILLGKPIWERLAWDGQQLVTPDPECLVYLDTPKVDLPKGLNTCRASEVFFEKEFDARSDCYYLGLILYLAITGVIPYQLKHGWATQAIVQGKMIPPIVRRPEISPVLSELVMALLSSQPNERPTTAWVADFWENQPYGGWYLADLIEMSANLRQGEAYHRKLRYQYLFKRIQTPMLIGLSLGLILKGGSFWWQDHATPSPLKIAEAFYDQVGGIRAPVTKEFGEKLFADFEEARTVRQQIISEAFLHPLAEVTKIRVLRQTMALVLLQVELKWWDWQEQSWQQRISKERLLLKKNGRIWRVAKRYLTDKSGQS